MESSTQQDRYKELGQQAAEFLANKTPEELIELQELLLEADLDESIIGDAFGYGCSELTKKDSAQQLRFGLLLTQHASPAMRKLAYWRLKDLQGQSPEAEEALWALLDDPDREVAEMYLERLSEGFEEPLGSFPHVIELATKLVAARKRLRDR